MRPGSRWQSVVCSTQVVVVRPPSDGVDLRCGGHPMVPIDADRPEGATLDPAHGSGTLTGKRFTHEASGLELLCTQAGDGSLSAGTEPLTLKDAKPTPSSD